jgi:8-oxo-dGTP pyrophosphatase MutT (NUDIX family)
MLHLDPDRPAVIPREAATLLVLRPADRGFEVFCVRRHAASAFMGGAVVFPGGKLDDADRSKRFVSLSTGVHPRASGFADDDSHALALAVCACREALEEAHILPVSSGVEEAVIERMHASLTGGRAFADVASEAGVVLATKELVPFARWITPEAEQRRYDARFFMTVLPDRQSGRHDQHETVSSVWTTPARILESFLRGDVFLAPPTLRAFELLLDVSDLDTALALADEQSLLPICPRFVPNDPPMLVLPGDPEHEVRDQRVAGPTRFVLRDGKFLSDDPRGTHEPR